MATYQFSALADGQTISFNPNTDVLNFDQSFIAAASVRAAAEGANLRVSFGEKDVLLTNVSPLQLATSNITFADGSRLLFGDNTTGTANDNAGNSLVGTSGNDLLAGFGGADTLNGGAGNDAYFVGTGDVILDSGGVDTVFSDVSWTLASGLENLVLTGAGNITAQGNNGNNVLTGNAGNNYFNARAGNDTILAGAGNDTIDMSTGGTPDQGTDSVDGGLGIDTLDYDGYARSAVRVSVVEGYVSGGSENGVGFASISGIERFIGGAFNDHISGYNASEYLDGRAGNDTIAGGLGNDTLIGGAGADELRFHETPGAANADQVVGFVSGTDTLVLDANAHDGIGFTGAFVPGDARFWSSTSGAAHDASDRVIYNTGNGQLWYDADGNGAGAAQLIATLQGAPALAATDIEVLNGVIPGQSLTGTSGDDSIEGGGGDDTLSGLGGNDTLIGNGGSDRLEGGAGNDSLYGGHESDEGAGSADHLIGGDGNDTLDGYHSLNGEAAVDTLDGGLGDDYYVVDNENDVLIDTGGTDTVEVFGRDYTLAAGYENMYLNNGWNESLAIGIGNELDNHMVGGYIVTLEGRGGNDTLIGSTEEDTLIGDEGDDMLDAGWHDDTLDGGSGNDTLLGRDGDDILSGGAGDDWLDGGNEVGGPSNRDILTGGAGADQFQFSDAPWEWSEDSITDFASGLDSLRFDAAAMPELGAGGRMSAGDGRFYATAGASSGHDADDRLIYNTSTRELFFDADGNGAQAAQLVATLQAGATLAATDIVVDNGTSGMHVVGTSGNDSLVGGEGNDTLEGLGGNDTLTGNEGADSMLGGDGNDVLNGNSHRFAEIEPVADTMDGGLGDDVFQVDNPSDVLIDAGGVDTVVAENIGWTLAAGFENLTIFNGQIEWWVTGVGNDLDNILDGSLGWFVQLEGRGGNDLILGSTQDDNLLGGDGADTIDGGGSEDGLDGGAGNDSLNGNWGEDWVDGGAGDDWVDGGDGYDTLIGGEGADDFSFGANPLEMTSDRVFDFASGIDTLRFDASVMPELGASGRLSASDGRFYAASNATSGHDADDRLIFDTWSLDLYFDPDGNGSQAAQLIVRLNAGATLAATDIVIDNGSGGMHIVGTTGNDSLVGGNGDDTIEGLAGDDTLIGGLGNDRIESLRPADPFNGEGNLMQGGAGADTLVSGGRQDTMEGGAGADDFLLELQPITGIWTFTTVTDFISSVDRFVLDAAVFTRLGGAGNFSVTDGRFYAAPGASSGHDADDRIVYDTSSGQLYYDPDGNGSGTFAPIARLAGAPGLAATDITVVGNPPAAIVGTEGNDSLNGTVGEDTIEGRGGDDLLFGDEGGDLLIGGAGNDTLSPGSFGHGDTWADTLDGGLGDDEYHVFDDGDVIAPDAGGIDTVHFTGAEWTLGAGLENLLISNADGGGRGLGNELDNLIQGFQAWISGMAGNDHLVGSGRIEGGDGNDTLEASGRLFGDAGNDVLNGFADDSLTGGTGADRFIFDNAFPGETRITDFQSGADKVVLDGDVYTFSGISGPFSAGDARFWASSSGTAHDASDRVVYNTATGQLWYDSDGTGASDAVLIATLEGAPAFAAPDVEIVNGSSGSIDGTAGNDSLSGTAANDTINGLAGNDTLSGLAGDDRLDGGAGADSMIGGAGNDRLSGQAGIDRLQGGAGNDTFVFDMLGSENRDIVQDFASGVDKLEMEDSVMTAIGATGNFATADARFWAAAGATSGHDASDRIVYNSTNGDLYYDADGSGAGAARFVGNISGHPALAATDIAVI